MDRTGFDHLTQDLTAFLSRRRLLRVGAFGTAGLVATNAFTQTQAKNNHKQKRSKKGDANKLCKTQVAPCEELLSVSCAGDPKCLATVQTCCPAVSTCDLSEFLACLTVNQA